MKVMYRVELVARASKAALDRRPCEGLSVRSRHLVHMKSRVLEEAFP